MDGLAQFCDDLDSKSSFISLSFHCLFIFITYNPQLHESVAKLVTENLYVKRWLFKMDNEFDGRGTGKLCSFQILICHLDNFHK